MSKLTKEEKAFFEMINNRDTKKISLNLSRETLDKIDELAKMFKITRTLVIESLSRAGLKQYLKTIESANKKLKRQYPENKRLDLMLNDIKKFQKKWKM